MPNRIISSGILTSDSLSQLSWFDQCVFFRLLVLADDYGRYDARPAVIRGQAFSLYDVTNKDIENALSRLAAVGIIGLYEVGGRSYLQLEHWSKYQRVRNSKEKFPAPPNCQSAEFRGNSPRVAASCGLNPIQSQSNPNPTPHTPQGAAAAVDADLGRVADFYQQNIGTLAPSTYQQMQEWLTRLSADVLILAMQAAVDQGKRTWAYIRGILKRCADNGIKTAADYKAAEERHSRPKQQEVEDWSKLSKEEMDRMIYGD